MCSLGRSAWVIQSLMKGSLFNAAVPVICLFTGYMKQIFFDCSYLLKIATILGILFFKYFLFFHFLLVYYHFHYSNCSHSSLELVYQFLSQKEWQSSFLWSALYLFWQENLRSSIVWVFSSAVLCLFSKKAGSS